MQMTEEQQVKKIQEIRDKAIAELKALGVKRHTIIRNYIKELEQKKIEKIRANILGA